MATAASLTLRTSRPGRRKASTRPARRVRYQPYNQSGEILWLSIVGIAGFLWVGLPTPFLIKFIGSIALFLVLPTTLLKEYWPKHHLHDLGWKMPDAPRQSILYTALVTAIAFLPIWFFLRVDNPVNFVAVSPNGDWIPWFIAEGLVSILAIAQSAFFCGLLLFRLAHLVRPWVAILLIGLILTMGQLFVPGTLGLFSLPLSFAFAWMAWQTNSFVPVAVTQLLLSVTFDFLVRLSVR